mmetsp:Transcript_114289/g.357406  ORF Transcript_114289/g.357406 Transcript_114289/m.357406 type:complete len:84 (-) Transcript_114289:92-343(-)
MFVPGSTQRAWFVGFLAGVALTMLLAAALAFFYLQRQKERGLLHVGRTDSRTVPERMAMFEEPTQTRWPCSPTQPRCRSCDND